MTAYHQLMEYLNLATKEELQSKSSISIQASYNLLLTQRWMMIIPRSKGNYKGMVSVNGFGIYLLIFFIKIIVISHQFIEKLGFYGLLLFSNETALNIVRYES